MKFNSIDELNQWLIENNYKFSDVDVVPLCNTCVTTTVSSENTTQIWEVNHLDNFNDAVINVPSVFGTKDIDVKIKSISESPKIKLRPLSEADSVDVPNVWYVDDFESVEDACGTSKILYNGDIILMNVCESNGQSTVKLIVEIDGKIANLPFILEKSCNNTSGYDIILSL